MSVSPFVSLTYFGKNAIYLVGIKETISEFLMIVLEHLVFIVLLKFFTM